MFDSDSLFPQAISAFADCCKAAAGKAGTMPRRDFSRGRRNAAPRFFKRPARCPAAIFQEAGAMPCHDFSRGRRNAAPQFLKRPARCRAAIFQEASAMPRRDFSRGRHNAAPRFLKRPARYPDCRAAISQEAGTMPQSPRRSFSFSRRNTLITALLFCSFGRGNPLIAAPQLFLLAGAIP